MCGPPGGSTSRRAHALRKCEICVFYLKGMCPSGDSCSYAHGFDELRAMSLTDKESQSTSCYVMLSHTFARLALQLVQRDLPPLFLHARMHSCVYV